LSPRVISTDRAGTPNTPFDYLRASPKTPFTIGKILSDRDLCYGFSGLINYDITAAPTYQMIQFVLERNALMKFQFNADYDFAGAAISCGYNISIDGTAVMMWQRFGGTNGEGAYMPIPMELFIPKDRPVLINLLNPDASAGLIQASMTIAGRYVE
jgi:hypothetical protein